MSVTSNDEGFANRVGNDDATEFSGSSMLMEVWTRIDGSYFLGLV